jgi:hypothetical protein
LNRTSGYNRGALNFADARASSNLKTFFNLTKAPRAFKTIKATLDANYFIHDTPSTADPDDY